MSSFSNRVTKFFNRKYLFEKEMVYFKFNVKFQYELNIYSIFLK